MKQGKTDQPAKDPGLQAERTRQAWSRTLFVAMLDSILFLRIGLINRSLCIFMAGGLLLVLVIGVSFLRHFLPAYQNNGLKIHSSKVLVAVSLVVIIACGLSLFGIIYADRVVFAAW